MSKELEYSYPESVVKAKVAEVERLRTALNMCVEVMEHAIELGYVGEGSTRGMFNDAVHEALTALSQKVTKDE